MPTASLSSRNTSQLHKLVPLGLVIVALALPALATAAPWGFLVSADGKQRMALDKASVVVGTSARCDAVLRGQTISKKQAVLTHDKGIVKIQDLRSRYGTLVAGTLLKRGQKMQLFKATKLTFGAVTWTFQWGERGKLIAPLSRAKTSKKSKKSGSKGKVSVKKSKPDSRKK
ncbi:MAG: FHA domain-containing protein [Myxococcales bacterium]|nr:FHA domain-containing protein [Myxococcales bacterium]